MEREIAPQATPVKIIDVRLDSEASQATSAIPLRSAILAGLNNPTDKKSLPTALLYDERGLRLYDLITTDAPEYYLFPLEEAILRTKGAEIITTIHGEKGLVDGEVFLELGAGSLRKTSHLLYNLAALVDKKRPSSPMDVPPATYYALDLERRELERTLNQIAMTKDVSSAPPASEAEEHPYGALGEELSGRVAVRGIWGTYEGGIQFINQNGLEKLRTADLAEAESDGHKPVQEHASANTNVNVNTVLSSFNSSSSDPSSKSQSDSASGSSGTTPPSPISSSPLLDDKYAQPTSTDAGAGAPARKTPLHLLFLGSSLGNFTRPEMIGFLSRLPLRPGSGDTLLIGLDGDNGKERIEKAYNDAKGITKDFIMNGLRVAGLTLGDESLFTESKWEYVNFYNETERRHEAYYKSVGPQSVKIPSADLKDTETIINFEDGELVNIEVSHKFSTANVLELFSSSNLRIIQQWKDPQDLYGLYLVERPAFHFPLVKELPPVESTQSEQWDIATLLDEPNDKLSPYSIPTIKDWKEMWKAWDAITLGMIPPEMLHQKPIDLRHKCLFYLGHIPTFLDIHLSRLLKEPHTEPDQYKYIFERGIDPHVDDPTQCHPHSEVPDKDEDWPTLEEILDFRDRVRQRLLNVYADLKSGKRVLDRKTARVLFMTFEHEGLHAETLLYMLIQRAGSGTLPPPSFSRPHFESFKEQWDKEYQQFYDSTTNSETVLIPSGSVVLGHDDFEAEDATVPFHPRHDFGWDNEHPKRTIQLPSFRISWRPITNGEYLAYYSDSTKNKGENQVKMPASWVTVNGATCVRTLYGPMPFDIAKHWPVQAEYDDLSTYARVKGGRIPTVAELQAFWEKYQGGFVGSANVGFRNWHPVPATTGAKDGGQGHNGGIWEWTSTKLASYEGYVASTLYPGYSSDFFDDKHQVVIGGSYATIPRIAQRASVSNFYQHNYPYAWVGARIVYNA